MMLNLVSWQKIYKKNHLNVNCRLAIYSSFMLDISIGNKIVNFVTNII